MTTRSAVGLAVVMVATLFVAVFGSAHQAVAQDAAGSQAVRTGAAELVEAVVVRLEKQGAPDVGDAGVLHRYRAGVVTAFMLIAPIVLVAAVCAVTGADPGRLVRTVLGRLPVAVVVTVAAIALSRLWFELVDDLSAVWTGGAGGELAEALGGVAANLREPSAGAPFLGSVAAVMAGAAALAIWLELALRDGLVYVCLAFLPLTLVSTLLPATTAWMRRLVAILALVAATPLIITVVLDAGLAAMPAAGVDGLEAVLFGAGVMAVAAAAPFLAFRFLWSPSGRVGRVGPEQVPPPQLAPESAAPVEGEAHQRLALASATHEEALP